MTMTRIFFAKKQTFLEAKQVSGLFNRFSIQPLIGRHQKYLPRLSLHWRENGYQVSSNIGWGSKLLERVNKKLEIITRIRNSKKFKLLKKYHQEKISQIVSSFSFKQKCRTGYSLSSRVMAVFICTFTYLIPSK